MYINIPTPAAHSLLYSPTLLFFFYQKNQFKEKPWLFLASREPRVWEKWVVSSSDSNCKVFAPWFTSKLPCFYNDIDVSNVWCWISRYPKPARRFIWREGWEVFPQNDLKTYQTTIYGADFCPTGGNLSINSSPLTLLRSIFSLCCPPFLYNNREMVTWLRVASPKRTGFKAMWEDFCVVEAQQNTTDMAYMSSCIVDHQKHIGQQQQPLP